MSESLTDNRAVVVVDDDAAVRDSLKRLIESVGLATLAYESADQLLEENGAALASAGCMLLDIRMPGMSGLELQERLSARGITTPVIIISGHGDVPIAVRAMKAGAVDFIEKPFSDQHLLDQVYLALERDARARESRASDEEIQARFALLSPRERTVMGMVVSGKSNKEIAADLGLSQKTVEVHRARVMSKMQAESLAQLVRLAIVAGEDGQ